MPLASVPYATASPGWRGQFARQPDAANLVITGPEYWRAGGCLNAAPAPRDTWVEHLRRGRVLDPRR